MGKKERVRFFLSTARSLAVAARFGESLIASLYQRCCVEKLCWRYQSVLCFDPQGSDNIARGNAPGRRPNVFAPCRGATSVVP